MSYKNIRCKCITNLLLLFYGMARFAVAVDATSAALFHHPAWLKLDQLDCGESAADRIIGGTNAVLGQFPWIARLGYTTPDDSTPEWLCGGALITDRHVITAAHCIHSSDESYVLAWVRLGEHDTQKNPDCQLLICAPPVQDKKIARITIHGGFQKSAFHNDIAVMELAEPVQFNDYVSPICLPRAAQSGKLMIGEPLIVAGWGKMNMTTDQRADVLQVVQVPVVKPETCDGFGKEFKISRGELCAGAQLNKDACGGDSGGPLMKVYDTPEGPKYFLVGVVSFGPTVCGIKKPGVYSSVTYFLKWILDNISKPYIF